jgi:hypothetical protein
LDGSIVSDRNQCHIDSCRAGWRENGGSGDHAKRALGADEQLFEIVT